MKTTRLLRMLSLLGFLLLLAPFYDSCDGCGFRRVRETTLEGKQIEIPFYLQVYDSIVDEGSFSGFEIASIFPLGIQDFKSFNEFKFELSKSFQKEDWYKNIGMLVSFTFDFIALISFSLFIFSFTKNKKLFTKLALINCILVIITFSYIVFLESSFEHWNQIKWGYYAFILTNIVIFYYLKTNKPQLE